MLCHVKKILRNKNAYIANHSLLQGLLQKYYKATKPTKAKAYQSYKAYQTWEPGRYLICFL